MYNFCCVFFVFWCLESMFWCTPHTPADICSRQSSWPCALTSWECVMLVMLTAIITTVVALDWSITTWHIHWQQHPSQVLLTHWNKQTINQIFKNGCWQWGEDIWNRRMSLACMCIELDMGCCLMSFKLWTTVKAIKCTKMERKPIIWV